MYLDWSKCILFLRLIEELKKESRGLEAILTSNGVFEVTHIVKMYIFNLIDKTYSCRKWDLTGIQCFHGVASIMIHKGEINYYVHECYFIIIWRATQNHIIYPIPDESIWVRTPYDKKKAQKVKE